MPITTVIIISLLLANLALTLIMFLIIHDLLEVTKSLQDSEDLLKKSFDINNQLIEKYDERLNLVYERETNLHDGISLWQENAEQSYDTICSAYKTMYDQYKLITDMQTKLLNCWKGCEERYSQSYEEFKHCSDKLKEISFQLTDLANVSTEDEYTLTLADACDTVCCDCPYDQCLKDGDCPVWTIKMRQKEIEAEWEEYDEAERWKARHKGDNTVELDK